MVALTPEQHNLLYGTPFGRTDTSNSPPPKTQPVLGWEDIENLGYDPDGVARCISELSCLRAQMKKLQADNTLYVLKSREVHKLHEDYLYGQAARKLFTMFREAEGGKVNILKLEEWVAREADSLFLKEEAEKV